jgi:hypothetical protein
MSNIAYANIAVTGHTARMTGELVSEQKGQIEGARHDKLSVLLLQCEMGSRPPNEFLPTTLHDSSERLTKSLRGIACSCASQSRRVGAMTHSLFEFAQLFDRS